MSIALLSVNFVALLFASAAAASVAPNAPGSPNAPTNPTLEVATAQQKIRALAVPFVPNAGQWDRRAAFKANTLGGAVFVTTEGALVYSFPGKALDSGSSTEPGKRAMRHVATERGPGWALSETLIDRKGQARPLKPAGLGPNETKVSYFTADYAASHNRAINTYNRVQLGEVYPGVNLQLRATGNNMEKIFTVAPGHSPKQIQLKLDGAERLEVNAEGQLVALTGNGPISFTAPIAFQEDAQGKRDPVTVAYALDADHARYGFTLGPFDASRALIIDPLLQSTYLGGSDYDQINAITVHPGSGEVIVAGYTGSSNLPGTVGGVQTSWGGSQDGFITRFNATLTTLLQSTYLGGIGGEIIYAIAVHPVSGEVIVAGYTDGTLPGTAGGAQPTFGGSSDGFVSRFNATLTTLLQSSYLGGTGDDQINALTVHPVSGEVIAAGYTTSTNLPGAAGGAQAMYSGRGTDGFVTRFNANLTTLLQSSYLGGTNGDLINAITVHPVSGEVIVAGKTQSTTFPGTAGGAQITYGGGFFDGFVSRFNASLTMLLQSSYLGGSGDNVINAITVHPVSGEVIVAGYTTSTNLPGTAGGAQATFGGGQDGFVSRFNAVLTTRLQSSYLGGTNIEDIRAIAVHPVSGEVIVAGYTTSTNLPGTAGGAQATFGGGQDGFVSRFNAALTTRLQSSYLGGSGDDVIYAMTVHPVSGEVIVAGYASSGLLPGTVGGARSTYGGGYDGFVSRLTPNLTAPLCNLDINGDAAVTPENDGLLLLRYALGFRGATLIAGVPLGAARANAAAVETFIGSSAQYQVFGQPSAPAKAMQDGLVLLRLMRGIGDSALLNGIAPPTGATFTTGSTVRANVNARCGTAY